MTAPEQTLHDLLPAPVTTSPTAPERDRIEARLREGLRHQARREQRATAWRERAGAVAAPGVVLACLGAVVTLTVLVAGSPAPESGSAQRVRPVVAAPLAVQVLDRASRNAARRDVTPPAPGELLYARSIVRSNEGRYGGPVQLAGRHVREIWLSQEDGPTQDLGLIREFGQDWPIRSGGPVPAGPARPTYGYLASLPTDPDELLDALESQLAPWDDARTRDQVVFDQIASLMGEVAAPPDVTAALFQALTRIPGVQVEAGARDLLGRPGVGLTRTDGVFLTRDVLILDPRTGEVIGTRSYMDGPQGETLYGATALVQRGTARRAGEPPVPPADAPRATSAAGRA
ncbi:CU044_5270 family protein [Nocardioides sp. 503]|uniref:CU044_5270 family protein n=1 Tax=Nocardioides sp. 503 TaxID=2508326 RepID=UPI00106F3D3E|nr:CU044_5270 family protein [Nocardioides sp. 503]